MLRNQPFMRIFAITMLVVVSSPAFGASAAKEISGFYKIKVDFTKNAKKCGFESLEPFERYLRKHHRDQFTDRRH